MPNARSLLFSARACLISGNRRQAALAYLAAARAAGDEEALQRQAVESALGIIDELVSAPPTSPAEDAKVRQWVHNVDSLSLVATAHCCLLLTHAAAWLFDLFNWRQQVEDIVNANNLAAHAVDAGAAGSATRLRALSLLVHIRNSIDDYLPADLNTRGQNADWALEEAREMCALAKQLPDITPEDRVPIRSLLLLPSPAAGPVYDLARILRLRSLRRGDTANAREALARLDEAESLLEPDLDVQDRDLARMSIANVRGLCWKDLRDDEPTAIDNEVEAFQQAADLASASGLQVHSNIEVNLRNALAARAARDAVTVGQHSRDGYEASFDLYRQQVRSGDQSPEKLKMTVFNWARLAAEVAAHDEVVQACEAGLDGLRRFVHQQGGIAGARVAAAPIAEIGTRLAQAHIALGDLWAAAAAIDRSRALVLDSSEGRDADATSTVATIRRAATNRCVSYVFEPSREQVDSVAQAIVIRPGEDQPVLVSGGTWSEFTALAELMGEAMDLLVTDHTYQHVQRTESLLRETSIKLWHLIVDAIADACTGHAELALIISGNPYFPLSLMPFTLAGPEDGPGLIDLIAPSYPLSARHLVASQERWRNQPEKVLVLASAGAKDRLLTEVDSERDAVAEAWSNSATTIRSVRTVAEARSLISEADIIHAACHARFDRDNPFHSTLRLDDGDLELHDLKLQASLVYLSACSTGRRGANDAVAEAMSLASLMHRAGAGAVVSTEWDVLDPIAQSIALLFYEAVTREQVEPVQALRLAQLRLRDGNFLRGDLTRTYLSPKAEWLKAAGPFMVNWGAYTFCGAGAPPPTTLPKAR